MTGISSYHRVWKEVGAMKEKLTQEAYWFWFCGLYPLSVEWKEALLNEFGNPEEIYHASERRLERFFAGRSRMGPKSRSLGRILESREGDAVRRAMDEAEKKEIRLITLESGEYPNRLRVIPGRPPGLFVRGRLPGDDRPAAAIVGSRSCSFYGSAMAERLGRALAGAGVQVISGLARGIDSAGHRGALERDGGEGATFAVLGCGPDVVYPPEHGGLYRAVEEDGGIISEYPPGVRPFPANFPARNRLISGLSDCVAVVEAGRRSGSLITASFALEQGKEIFAVPGRAGDYLSAGTNSLLKDGAQVLTEPEDLLQFWGIHGKKLRIYEKNQILLDKNQEKVYSCVDSEPKSVEQIRAESGLSGSVLAECLLDLEMEGLIIQPSDHYYAAKGRKGEHDHYGKVSGHRRVPGKSKDN